jgi:hypothetical protein
MAYALLSSRVLLITNEPKPDAIKSSTGLVKFARVFQRGNRKHLLYIHQFDVVMMLSCCAARIQDAVESMEIQYVGVTSASCVTFNRKGISVIIVTEKTC